MTDDVVAEITRLIHKLMPELEEAVTSDSTFEELGMDSLARVDLLTAAEDTFGIKVPDEALENILDVRSLAGLVSERIS